MGRGGGCQALCPSCSVSCFGSLPPPRAPRPFLKPLTWPATAESATSAWWVQFECRWDARQRPPGIWTQRGISSELQGSRGSEGLAKRCGASAVRTGAASRQGAWRAPIITAILLRGRFLQDLWTKHLLLRGGGHSVALSPTEVLSSQRSRNPPAQGWQPSGAAPQ